ncbi:MAG: alpha/beta hydrolase [Chloroflexi bacterium]|nr:alpha/beta hydrolase [Chloroflexota bacterium]
MSTLEVPGAYLYYEVSGNGPLLILVPGSNGGADIFTELVSALAAYFRVVTYDRRGFSRSKLVGPQDDGEGLRLQTDVEDLRQLTEHLDDKEFSVFGTDSGAIVGLELLARYPDHLVKLVAHEPPVLNLLPDASKWKTLFEEVYETYRKEGVPKAMHLYASSIRSADHRLLMPYVSARLETGERSWANAAYWMEHELRQYSFFDLDLTRLAASSSRLVLARGQDSKDQFTGQPAQLLAQRLGINTQFLPGGHLGYLSNPGEFARGLVTACQ